MFRKLVLVLAVTASTAGAQSVDDLSLGQTISTEPQPGQTYVKDVHGDWEVRCTKAPEGQSDRCTLYQLLRQADGNPISEISLFSLPPGQQAVAGATIITPLESLLQKGLQMRVDDGETKIYPFSFCNRVGCHARVGLTAIELAGLERGSEAFLIISALAKPEQPIEISVSLSGFTAAYDSLLGP